MYYANEESDDVIGGFTKTVQHLIGLSNNPERFTESNTENSWNEYINNMPMQGTRCDALFVQALADCQNVAIQYSYYRIS